MSRGLFPFLRQLIDQPTPELVDASVGGVLQPFNAEGLQFLAVVRSRSVGDIQPAQVGRTGGDALA